MSIYQPKLSDFSAKIKDVYIELKDYEFFHSPFSKDIKSKDGKSLDGRFIGRKSVRREIVNILKNSKSRSGAYLVAGFRGVGKTSVVRLAIQDYNEGRKNSKHGKQTQQNKYNFGVFDMLSKPDLAYLGRLFLFTISIALLFLLFLYFFDPRTFCNFFGICKVVDYLPNIMLVPKYWFLRIVLGIFTWWIINAVVFFTVDTVIFLLEKYLVNNLKLSGKNRLPNYKTFEINLSEDDLLEIDVLKRITQELLSFWNNQDKNSFEKYNRLIYLPFTWLLSIIKKSNSQFNNALTYDSIQNQLNILTQRISAQVTSENKLGVSPNFTVGLLTGIGRLATPLGGISSNRKAVYPVANAKEIEDELIAIFKNIDSFRDKNPSQRIPQFIFIIDELDKIELHHGTNIAERQFSDPSFDEDKNYREVTYLIRKRQESVAKLLANLKGFLNVVRAKFFFIGGRELYDASLADIADRDSFYSSVFNRIIYIDSFFKDKVKRRAGITQMTETYLCKIILSNLKMTSDTLDSSYTLKSLYDRLHFDKDKLFIGNSGGSKEDCTYLERTIKSKVLFLLQDFIIYLTYRSNGTPKKLATLIEKLITNDVSDHSNSLVVEHQQREKVNKDKLYLRFKFNFQYEVGLTSYIYRPYLIINSRNLKTYGDKLLFSSAFIFDHILKFHNYSFSWGNLELIPEVIVVNKEPNLRQFIEDLIHFLSKTQIRNTVSGINQYRFFNKIDTELRFLSKVSDLSSAAFNFTLDESLQIKRHYKLKLRDLERKYERYQPIEGDNQFIHSIAFIQTILGDLHYYDKEYDEALAYYNESIQTIRLPETAKMAFTKHQFFIALRNKLKAALTLEKMRDFQGAISFYATLTKDIPIHLEEVIYTQKVAHKNNTYRNVQLLSMPYIAFLAALEKSRNDGITYINLKEKEIELRKVLKLEEKDKDFGFYDNRITNRIDLDYYRKFFLMADYYNNVGSILFYKNCQFPMLFKSNFKNLHYLPQPLLVCLDKIYDNRITKDYDFSPSLSSFIYFYLSVKYLIEYHHSRLLNIGKKRGIDNLDNNSCLQLIPILLLKDCSDFINSGRFYYLANVLSKMGDSVLGSLDQEQLTVLPDWEFLQLFNFNKEKKDNNTLKSVQDFSKKFSEKNDLFCLSNVFLLYELAAAFYLRSGREQSFNYQYRKILYLMKDILGYMIDGEKSIISKEALETTINGIEQMACTLFRTITWAREVANRPQILKYRDIFNISDKPEIGRSIIYNNINTSPETREIVLLVEQIRLRSHILSGSNTNKVMESLSLNNLFISSYGTINHQYIRLLELEYRSDVNEYIVNKHLGINELFHKGIFLNSVYKSIELSRKIGAIKNNYDKQISNKEIAEYIKFLVKESIFCLREQIRSIHIYGTGSFLTYSYIAFAHEKLGYWCQAYRSIVKYDAPNKNEDNDFITEVKNMIGNHALAYLEPNFHFEEAVQNYYKSIQLHTEGRIYKENVLNIYMLEDDYNDNLKHFVMGLEKQRVNSGRIRRRVHKLQSNIHNSHLYKYASYFPVNGDGIEAKKADEYSEFLISLEEAFKEISKVE